MEKATCKALRNGALAVTFIGGATTLAWFKPTAAGIAICAVILVAIYGKLDSLVELSFGPLKAKLERNLSDSERLVQRLKTFSAIQARAAIAANAGIGRFASGDDWVFQTVKRVQNGLRELGVSEDDIADALSEFVGLTIGDAAMCALGGGKVPNALGIDAINERNEIVEEARRDPDAVEAYLHKWNLVSPERMQRIADMRWMIEHNDVRDSEQYMRAHTPVPWSNQ